MTAGAGPDVSPSRPTIGRYVVERELGRGGMGSVFAATDPELGRRVAIKLIGHGAPGGPAPDPESLARFRREAEAAARLDHPTLVSVIEVGEHAGCPYIVMEHVEGETLEALQRRVRERSAARSAPR